MSVIEIVIVSGFFGLSFGILMGALLEHLLVRQSVKRLGQDVWELQRSWMEWQQKRWRRGSLQE